MQLSHLKNVTYFTTSSQILESLFDINYLIQLKSYNCLAESYTILY